MRLMTRISITFTLPKESYRNELVVADYLQQVMENCPLLRTFILTLQKTPPV